MKKVKLIILTIYIVFVLLLSFSTIFFAVKTVKKGSDLYFQQKQPMTVDSILKESDVDKLIEVLKELKLIN